MRISMQCWTETGSFSNPYDAESEVFQGTLTQCKEEFEAWKELHLQIYSLDSLLNWREKGERAIVANCYRGNMIGDYPDFQLTLGRKGGIKISNC